MVRSEEGGGESKWYGSLREEKDEGRLLSKEKANATVYGQNSRLPEKGDLKKRKRRFGLAGGGIQPREGKEAP